MLLSGLGIVATPMLASATSASAALPAGQVAVAFAGSDTTDVMLGQMTTNGLGDLDGRSLTVNGSPTTVRTYNVPAFSSSTFAVPGDAECQDTSWVKDPAAPTGNTSLATGARGLSPFGSTAGRNYLATEDSGTGPNQYLTGTPSTTGTDFGCIDVARSSGGPRAAGAGDKATFEYYAFGLDGVSWASTSLRAPSTMTTAQLQSIYIQCTTTNWDQLPGGTTGNIHRYFPQAGSGTRSFAVSDLLAGGTPGTTGSCAGNALTLVEENNGNAIAAADKGDAILIYSGAVWTFQAGQSLNRSLDKRNGSQLGGITTAASTPLKSNVEFWSSDDAAFELDPSVVKEANVLQENPGQTQATGLYPGIRYVYNVLDSKNTSQGYQAAKQLVGFTNSAGGAKGVLCDATATGTGATEFGLIISNGFLPLPATANGTTNKAGSTCRFFAGVN